LHYFEHFTTSDRFIVCVEGVDAGVLQFTVTGGSSLPGDRRPVARASGTPIEDHEVRDG